MRETCSCGASIQTWSYKRIKEWRDTHLHETPEQPIYPAGADSRTEIGFRAAYYDGLREQPDVNV